jgi:hypothetical protein
MEEKISKRFESSSLFVFFKKIIIFSRDISSQTKLALHFNALFVKKSSSHYLKIYLLKQNNRDYFRFNLRRTPLWIDLCGSCTT